MILKLKIFAVLLLCKTIQIGATDAQLNNSLGFFYAQKHTTILHQKYSGVELPYILNRTCPCLDCFAADRATPFFVSQNFKCKTIMKNSVEKNDSKPCSKRK